MAQEWSKEDSLWLQNVLEGKDTLKINEETKKAIEDGRLIVPSWMKDMDTDIELELSKDFDDAGIPDVERIPNLNPYTMPPAVYALYVLYLEKMDSAYQIRSLIITDEERKQLEALLPTGAQIFYPFTADYLPGFYINTDLNHMISWVFSNQYRRIMYNRKHATAHKNYYNMGSERPFRITDYERKQLNQSVNRMRPSFKIATGNKTNGIDD